MGRMLLRRRQQQQQQRGALTRCCGACLSPSLSTSTSTSLLLQQLPPHSARLAPALPLQRSPSRRGQRTGQGQAAREWARADRQLQRGRNQALGERGLGRWAALPLLLRRGGCSRRCRWPGGGWGPRIHGRRLHASVLARVRRRAATGRERHVRFRTQQSPMSARRQKRG